MSVRLGSPHSRYRGFPPGYHHVEAKFFCATACPGKGNFVQCAGLARNSAIGVCSFTGPGMPLILTSFNDASLCS